MENLTTYLIHLLSPPPFNVVALNAIAKSIYNNIDQGGGGKCALTMRMSEMAGNIASVSTILQLLVAWHSIGATNKARKGQYYINEATVTLHIGWFQKISIPIPRAASRNSEGEGGYIDWNSEDMGGLRRLEFQGHVVGSLDWNSEGIRGFSGE